MLIPADHLLNLTYPEWLTFEHLSCQISTWPELSAIRPATPDNKYEPNAPSKRIAPKKPLRFDSCGLYLHTGMRGQSLSTDSGRAGFVSSGCNPAHVHPMRLQPAFGGFCNQNTRPTMPFYIRAVRSGQLVTLRVTALRKVSTAYLARSIIHQDRLTCMHCAINVRDIAEHSAIRDWPLCKTKKVHMRLRSKLSAFFVPALWWGVFEKRGLQKIGAARFPFWPLRPASSKTHPAAHRLASLSDRFIQLHQKGFIMPKHPSVTFSGTEIQIIDKDGEQWLTAADISRALGYKTDDSVTRLYNRSQDEFDDSMTWTVNLTVQGQERKTRIFNKRGCQLIALLSRTSKAKAFRKWVLDVLESDGDQQAGHHGQNPPRIEDHSITYVVHKMEGVKVVESNVVTVPVIQALVAELYPHMILANKKNIASGINSTMDLMQKAMAQASAQIQPLQLLLEAESTEQAMAVRMEKAMGEIKGVAA